MPILEQFSNHLSGFNLGGGRGLVAVSGGPDSLVLLDLLARSREQLGLELIVAHADHGIHPGSAEVAERVRSRAAELQLECEIGCLALGELAGETVSREARYRWLDSVRRARSADWIFTAHHADDQVETVLMRLLRGSGPGGLAGMADRDGWLIRPLLQVSRAMLEQYALEQGIQSWDDPANRDPRFLRSWLRHDVLPILRTRLPEVDRDLLRASRHAALDRQGWEQLLVGAPELDWQEEQDGGSLALEGLGAWEGALAVRLLASVGHRLGFVLGPTRSGRVMDLVRNGVSGATVDLGSGWRAERSFGRLRLVQEEEAPLPPQLLIEGSSGSAIWGANWLLDWRIDKAPSHQERNGLAAWFIPETMTVRRWAAGERIQPLRGRGRRLLARCFQDARIPRSRRDRWPVIESGGRLVWVPGVCRSGEMMPEAGAPALRVEARGR